MQSQGGNVRNPRGEPFGFIGVTNARKATIHLDLHAYHDLSTRHPWDMRPQSLSFPTKVMPDISPSQADQDSFPAEGIRVKKHFSGPPGPRWAGETLFDLYPLCGKRVLVCPGR